MSIYGTTKKPIICKKKLMAVADKGYWSVLIMQLYSIMFTSSNTDRNGTFVKNFTGMVWTSLELIYLYIY